MVDLVITAANVVPGANATVRNGSAGATIAAGEVVYLDSATSTYKLADANGAAALRSPRGIALNGASAGQPLAVAEGGDVTLGVVLTAGVAYYLSGNPGKIAPVADLVAGHYPVILGIATSTSVLNLKIHESGVSL